MKRDGSHIRARVALATLMLSTSCVLLGHRGVKSRLVRHSLRTEAVGCWALFDQTGQSAQGRLYWAPAVARLLETREEAGSGEFHLVRLDSAGRNMRTERERGFTYWSADSLTDSIRIGVSSGFSGTQFVFALPVAERARDTVRGRAYEHWDYKANTNRGRAMAVRTSCPAPS
jgi:hypothetical protein